MLLQELKITDQNAYRILDLEEVIKVLKTHCASSLWMLEKGELLYKGIRGQFLKNVYSFKIFDSNKIVRKSTSNAGNYYTEILDNHPEMKDYPKRSKSIICSSSLATAKEFGITVVAVIPFDNAKVGNTHVSDIWQVKTNLFNSSAKSTFITINAWLKDLKLGDTIKDMKEYSDRLKNDPQKLEYFKEIFRLDQEDAEKYSRDFIGELWKAYSPDKTKFTWEYAKNMQHLDYDTEYWVQGNAVYIPIDNHQWGELLSHFVK